MRFAIDVVFLDKHDRICKIVAGLQPWRQAVCRQARQVIELAAGQAQACGLAPGQRLTMIPAPPQAGALSKPTPSFPLTRLTQSKSKAQSGATMVELLVLAFPLVMLGTASLETARWLFARHNVDYALYEALRAGTVNGGQFAAVGEALQQGLLPLRGGGSDASQRQFTQGLARRQAQAFASRFELPVLRMQQLNPTPASFDDFATDTDAFGARRIRNSYQALQHAEQPLGKRSGQTIFEANQLRLRLTYLHRVITPGVGALIRWAAQQWPSADPFIAHAMQTTGSLAIVADLRLPMQSDPVEASSNEYWLRGDHFDTLPPPLLPEFSSTGKDVPGKASGALLTPCVGIRCINNSASTATALKPPKTDPVQDETLACTLGDTACDAQCGVNYCCASGA